MKEIAPEQVIPPTGLFFYGIWIAYRLLQYNVQHKKDCMVIAEQLKNIIFIHQAWIASQEQPNGMLEENGEYNREKQNTNNNTNDNHDTNERKHEYDLMHNPYRILVLAFVSKLIEMDHVIIEFIILYYIILYIIYYS